MIDKITDSIVYKFLTIGGVTSANATAFFMDNVDKILAIFVNILTITAVLLLVVGRKTKNCIGKMDKKIKKLELEQKELEFKMWRNKQNGQ